MRVEGRRRAGSKPFFNGKTLLARACVLAFALFAHGAQDAAAQGGPATPEPKRAADGALCLDPQLDHTAAPPISVDLVATAPVDMCAPTYQVIEFRNLSDAPLGAARLMAEPPLGPGRMRFLPLRPGAEDRVEISTDDGASWRPVLAPSGRGIEGDPLVWSERESPGFGRLGPSGAPDDSILLRWRAALGDGFGDPFGPTARLVLQGEATDACGREVASALRSARIALSRPDLRARLTGRNLTRGGAFGERVRAAPGDRIEWRIDVENVGDAPAEAGIAQVSGAEGAELLETALEPIAAGGRRVATLEQTVGPYCAAQPVRASVSWGCAPPAGSPAAIDAGPAGMGRATIDAALSAADLELKQRIVDRGGAARPGAEADVIISVVNHGAPAFAPVFEILLPDGYGLDRIRPPEVYVTAGRSFALEVAEAPDGAVTVSLTPAGGGAERAALDPDASLELRFGVTRDRPTLLQRDQLETTLRVEDACGLAMAARPARTAVESRRPELAVALRALGSPLVGRPGDHVRFAAEVTNDGDETARAPYVQLALGEGWRGGAIAGCAPEPAIPARDAAPASPRRYYRCAIGRDLPPNGRAELLFDLHSALDPTAGPVGIDALAVEAEARFAGPSAPGGIGAAVARADGVGFLLRQRLLTEAGAPRDPDQPIDLGERALLELDALWFAGGGARIEGATLTQALAPGLRLLSSEEVAPEGGWPAAEVAGLLTPSGFSGGRAHWSIEPFAGQARLVARLLVEAVDRQRGVAAASAGGGAAIRRASLEAIAVFSRDGRRIGIDQTRDPGAAADSLPIVFRRPDIRLGFSAERPESIGSDPGFARIVVERARFTTHWIGLQNAGSGPGFVDWMTLTTPPGVEIAPSESDGLDNDADGVVDEADEAIAATIEQIDGGAERRRWTGLPGASAAAAAAGAGSGRIAPGELLAWPIAIRLDPTLSPGESRVVSLEASIGARPLAERADARQRARRDLALTAPAVEGFLVVGSIEPAEARRDSASARRLRHGDRVELRASLDAPLGPIEGLTLRVDLPPALAAFEPISARPGAGLVCADAAPPRRLAPEEGGPAVLWRLGDCRGDQERAKTSRRAILDISGRLTDAPGGADAGTLAVWRDIAPSASVEWRDAEGRQRRAPLARTKLAMTGPSLAWRVVEGFAGPHDAGDAFDIALSLVNRGDEPAEEVAIIAPQGAGLDCASLRLSANAGVPEQDLSEQGAVAEGCGGRLVLPQPVAPGDAVAVALSGRLAADAPAVAGVQLALQARSAEDAFPAARRALSTPPFPLARPALTLEAIAEEGGATADGLAPGGRVRLTAAAEAPESGETPVLEIAARLVGTDGAPLGAAETHAAIALFQSAPGGDGVLTDALRLTAVPETDPSPGGWARFRAAFAPAGLQEAVQAQDRPAPRPLATSAILTLADAPAARAGRRLEFVARLLQGPRVVASETRRIEIVEPFLDLAARAINQPSPRLEARVCNRGSAPAYGVALALKPPRGARLRDARLLAGEDPAALPAARAGIAPAPIGSVARRPDGALRVESGAAALPAGDCFLLLAEIDRASSASGPLAEKGAPVAVEIALESFRAGQAEARPGRVYSAAQATSAPLPPLAIALSGPARVAAVLPRRGPGAGEALSRISAPFVAEAPASGGVWRIGFEASSTPELVWTLYRDLDGDGLRDGDEPRLEEGALAALGGAHGATIAIIAEATLSADRLKEAWRGLLTLRAVGVGEGGASALGAKTVALLGAPSRPEETAEAALKGLAARRLMAVDRDCDGDRADELGQDALFETSKLAAPGECVIMRLEFENLGREGVDGVAIEDRPPSASRYVPDSGRFAATPAGLISGAIHEPSGAHAPAARGDGAGEIVRFDFIGILAPGQSGAVEYRVRLTDGS